jgi:hypothetical protein
MPIFFQSQNFTDSNTKTLHRCPHSNFHWVLYSTMERRPCASIVCLHSTTPTKFLMALDLNLPPEEGDREAIPDLNGDVEEAQDPGGDCAQQDHVQGGGNPAEGVERDVHVRTMCG